MRLDATISEVQGEMFTELAELLGQSRSATVGDAMSLFVKVCQGVLEGRRLVFLDEENEVEITTPALTTLEWIRHRDARDIPASAFARMVGMVEKPAAPTPALEKAAKRTARGRRAYVHNKKG